MPGPSSSTAISIVCGEAASAEHIAAISHAITTAPNVRHLINLRTEHIAPEELLIAAKIEFDHNLSVPQLSDAINEVETRVRAEVPIARRLFIEPDIQRAAGVESSHA